MAVNFKTFESCCCFFCFFFLFCCDAFDVRTMNNQNSIKSSFQRCPESLLIDLRKTFVFLDDFVTCPVQFATEYQIVESV